uniref:Uncharacterized protein n=1 Tax=Glossina pallidipes TaxID=7398 RepID=A0A1B0A7Q4_GLOPL
MTESELKLKRQKKYLGRYRDWHVRSLGIFLQMGFPPNHFTHVIIGMPASAREPNVTVAQVSKERAQRCSESTFKSNYPRSIRATLPRNAIPFITFAHASAGIVGTSATPSIRRENAAPKSLAGRNRINLL